MTRSSAAATSSCTRGCRAGWVLAVPLLLLSPGCGELADEGSPRAALSGDTLDQPIVNGTFSPTLVDLSPGQELAIGFLARGEDGVPFCTATLIGPDVALGAGHCVKGWSDRELRELRFGIGRPWAARARLEVRRVSLSSWEYDALLLQLEHTARSEVPEIVPLRIHREPLDGSFIGEAVEASGYHQVGDGEAVRRYGVLEIANVLDLALVVEGGGVRGVCHGDSGGPLLWTAADGQPETLALTLGGNQSCLDDSYHTRTDVLADWIDGEQAWLSSGAGGTGGATQGERRVPSTCLSADPRQLSPLLLAVVVLGARRRRDVPRAPVQRS